MGLFSALPYLIPGICVCLIPLSGYPADASDASANRPVDIPVAVPNASADRPADGPFAVSNASADRPADGPFAVPNASADRPVDGPAAVSDAFEDRSGGPAFRRRFLPAALLCAVMLFRNLIYLNGWMEVPQNFLEDSIFGVGWTANYGPLKGIVNGAGAYVADVSYLEWQDMIREGDRVMVLSYPTLTPTVYLYRDVEICADSTISTPTYSERLFSYWEQNPDKYPNVVVVKCFWGTPMIGPESAVSEWLSRFPAKRVEDGTYWRYYFAD